MDAGAFERLLSEVGERECDPGNKKHAGTKTFLLLGALVGSFSFGALAMYSQPSCHPTPSPTPNKPTILSQPCGNTPEEARAAGCHFDINSFCWLASPCFDANLSTEFENIKTWRWWGDENFTIPISHDLVSTGNITGLYVSWDYHLRHCTVMWKKLHRAFLDVEKGYGAIDSYVESYHHTEHCEKLLLGEDGLGPGSVDTVIRVKYPDCRILQLQTT